MDTTAIILSRKNFSRIFAAYGALMFMTSCLTTTLTPVNDVPITFQKRDFYDTASADARYGNGMLFVYGNIHLVRNAFLPWNFYAHVRILDASGQVIAEIPAKLDRAEKHHPNDPRLDASIEARVQIPIDQIKRIEIVFDQME
jgi:hypothetical protein